MLSYGKIVIFAICLSFYLFGTSSAMTIKHHHHTHDYYSGTNAHSYEDSFTMIPFNHNIGQLDNVYITYTFSYRLKANSESYSPLEPIVNFNVNIDGPLTLDYPVEYSMYIVNIVDDYLYYKMDIYDSVFRWKDVSDNSRYNYEFYGNDVLITSELFSSFGTVFMESDFSIDYNYTYYYTPTPEPSSFLLVAAGLAGMLFLRKKALVKRDQ